MIALRFHPEAEEELARAAEWYERKRLGLGIELVAEVDRALAAISAAPSAYPFWLSGRPYRRNVLTRFPYSVFFRILGDAVEVVAVAHAKRHPRYWARRVPP